jgi:hypothetical protein
MASSEEEFNVEQWIEIFSQSETEEPKIKKLKKYLQAASKKNPFN